MDENLSMLIGFLLSDGSVYYDKSKNTYCIQFTNKNPKMLNIFKDLMNKCFGVEKFYENKCKNALNIRVFSTKIAKVLFSYSPSYRTLPCNSFPKANEKSFIGEPVVINSIQYPPCNIPNKILTSKILSTSFLKGFATCDGSFTVNKKYSIYRVEITCYHPILREQLSKCLELLDFQTRSNNKAVFVSGFDNCRKFLDNVGFLVEKTGSL